MKRFFVSGVTRDKEYYVTRETPGSRILYFSANPNGEAEVIRVVLKPRPRLKKLSFEYDFADLAIKGRASMGNVLSKNDVHKITLKTSGVSTLGGRKIWFDKDVLRLNTDKRGDFLGEFHGDDRIVVLTKDSNFYFTNFDLSNHYGDDIARIEKYDANKVWSAVFYDADQDYLYLKRFKLEGNGKPQSFIGENSNNYLVCLSDAPGARFEIIFGGKYSDRPVEVIVASEFIGEKSFKARGKRLSIYEIAEVKEIEPLETEEEPKDSSTTEGEETENSLTTENSEENVQAELEM
jgi:topoisomerase-4 subunit A